MNIDNFVNDTLRELADMKNVEPPYFRWGKLTHTNCDDCLVATFHPILIKLFAVIEVTEIFKYLWRFYSDEVKVILRFLIAHELHHYTQLLEIGMGYNIKAEKVVGLRKLTYQEATAKYIRSGGVPPELMYVEWEANSFAESVTGINPFQMFTKFARLVDRFIDENPNDLLSEHNKEVMSEYIYRVKQRWSKLGWSEEMSWD